MSAPDFAYHAPGQQWPSDLGPAPDVPSAFELADSPEPFDLSSEGARTPPLVPSPTSSKRGVLHSPEDRQQAMKLAVLLPFAMKAGPGAVQGLLQGFSQAGDQRYARDRQSRLDADQQAQRDWTRQYQQGQLDNQTAAANRALLTDFMGRADGLSDPAASDALARLYEAEARRRGLDPSAFRTYLQQTATPDRLRAKRIAAQWRGLSAEQRQLAQQMGASITVDGEVIPYAVWSRAVGTMVDPATGAYPQASPKPDVPNTTEEAAVADALAMAEEQKGSVLTKAERARVRLQAVEEYGRRRRGPVRSSGASAERDATARAMDTVRGQLELAISQGQDIPRSVWSRVTSLGLDPAVEAERARQRVNERRVREARAMDLAGPDADVSLVAPDAVRVEGEMPPPARPAPRSGATGGGGGRGQGAAPARADGASPGSTRTASQADVRAVAARLGLSEAEARRQLEAKGVAIR